MNQRSAAFVLFLGILPLPVSAHMASGCFTPEEAKAAHVRTLQQEFNVAALNCRSLDPNDPSIAVRYNAFVSRFDAPLMANAQALRGHFKRAGGNIDVWMTRVANDAGQRVVTDPMYCQRASDVLDQVLVAEPAVVEELAVTTASYRLDIPLCAEAKAPPAVKHKATKVKAAKAKATPISVPAVAAKPQIETP